MGHGYSTDKSESSESSDVYGYGVDGEFVIEENRIENELPLLPMRFSYGALIGEGSSCVYRLQTEGIDVDAVIKVIRLSNINIKHVKREVSIFLNFLCNNLFL